MAHRDPRVGRRVRLVHCSDEHTRLTPGALGTITLVDDMGTVHVKWDDGSRLGMVRDAGDRFDLVQDVSDEHALDAIANMLCDPDWGSGMLEDIAELVRKTGRDVEGDDTPTWDRH